MKEQIKAIVAKRLNIPADDLDCQKDIMEIYGADSLDVVDMIFDLEALLGQSIPDEIAIDFKTVSDIIGYYEEIK